MQVSYVIFADAAEMTGSGKLALIGGNVDVLRIAAYPTVVSPLVAVVQLTMTESETSKDHIGRLELLSPEGQNILPAHDFTFKPGPNSPETAQLPVRFMLIANLGGTIIQEPGAYTLRVVVDGGEVGSASILAIEVPKAEMSGVNEKEE